MLKLILPFPGALCSLNSCYKKYRDRIVLSKKAKDYKRDVYFIVKQNKFKTLEDKVFIKVTAYLPDNRFHDIDGLLKLLFDALEDAQVYSNDNQIYKMLIEKKMRSDKKSYLDVEISPLLS